MPASASHEEAHEACETRWATQGLQRAVAANPHRDRSLHGCSPERCAACFALEAINAPSTHHTFLTIGPSSGPDGITPCDLLGKNRARSAECVSSSGRDDPLLAFGELGGNP